MNTTRCSKPETNLPSLLQKIKAGDDGLKNRLIKDYMPFIKRTILQNVRLDDSVEKSEEFSIGLIAFNEAIKRYNDDKNYPFIRFAEIVIKRRLIDFSKQRLKYRKEIPFSSLEHPDHHSLEEWWLHSFNPSPYERMEMNQEIKELSHQLKAFHIHMEDLLDCIPKHRDSKAMARRIADHIRNDPLLFRKFYKRKKIPVSEIVQTFQIHPKTIQRNRKFIITTVLLMGKHSHSFIS